MEGGVGLTAGRERFELWMCVEESSFSHLVNSFLSEVETIFNSFGTGDFLIAEAWDRNIFQAIFEVRIVEKKELLHTETWHWNCLQLFRA